ncbi:hypothetical protein SAMN05421821_11427 [Mucilaginibacter lappiensis]|uniref:Uncharacterized protein n=1 Tax=Mucilaginibacter lappiensis TaxID=354630 RepID=A0A1N7EFL9_9SPHI|nr:hypothetical protein [Mucilaginibacter lappiensis]MBB6128391.1 hypothetical protein [Mucilaginibacter lappiensis]SIR86963.1 hypothetical protein SAMN05421821_11427 [Mucilaginibacter lappiensis]
MFSTPSAEQLRVKEGRTWWLCAFGGASQVFAEAKNRANKVEQNNCSPWFCLLCRAKAMCGKEASLLTAFLVTFVATKVTGPPAAKSGSTPSQAALYSIEIINIYDCFFISINELPPVGCLRISQ